jgi:hypothetical protein
MPIVILQQFIYLTKLFYDRVRPLLELVLWPARVVIDWNSAADITGVK